MAGAKRKTGDGCGIRGNSKYGKEIATCYLCKEAPKHMCLQQFYCMQNQVSVVPEVAFCTRRRSFRKRGKLGGSWCKTDKANNGPFVAKEYLSPKSVVANECSKNKEQVMTYHNSPEHELSCLTGKIVFSRVHSKGTLHEEIQKFLHHPAPDVCWKGTFEVFDTAPHLYRGAEARFARQVLLVVYEISKKMPEKLKLKLLPRSVAWPSKFKLDPPNYDDVGLYFWCELDRLKEKFARLVERISSCDYAMQTDVGDFQLLIYSSKVLPAGCQCIDGQLYLWGVFRRKKQIEHEKENPPSCGPVYNMMMISSQSKESFPISQETNMENMRVIEKLMLGHYQGNQESSISCPDNKMEINILNQSNVLFPILEETDMEIDMIGGKEIGRIDKPLLRIDASRGFSTPVEPSWPEVPPGFSRNASSMQRSFPADIVEPFFPKVPPGFSRTLIVKQERSLSTKQECHDLSVLDTKCLESSAVGEHCARTTSKAHGMQVPPGFSTATCLKQRSVTPAPVEPVYPEVPPGFSRTPTVKQENCLSTELENQYLSTPNTERLESSAMGGFRVRTASKAHEMHHKVTDHLHSPVPSLSLEMRKSFISGESLLQNTKPHLVNNKLLTSSTEVTATLSGCAPHDNCSEFGLHGSSRTVLLREFQEEFYKKPEYEVDHVLHVDPMRKRGERVSGSEKTLNDSFDKVSKGGKIALSNEICGVIDEVFRKETKQQGELIAENTLTKNKANKIAVANNSKIREGKRRDYMKQPILVLRHLGDPSLSPAEKDRSVNHQRKDIGPASTISKELNGNEQHRATENIGSKSTVHQQKHCFHCVHGRQFSSPGQALALFPEVSVHNNGIIAGSQKQDVSADLSLSAPQYVKNGNL